MREVSTYSLTLKNSSPERRSRAAQELYLSRNPKALQILMQMLSDMDESVRLFSARALELWADHAQGDIKALRKTVEQAPEDPLRRRSLSDALCRYAALDSETEGTRHFLTEAIVHLEKALELQPNLPGNFLRLAQIYRRLGRGGEAKSVLEKVPPDSSYYADARLELAELAMERRDWEEVRAQCKRVEKHDLTGEQRMAVSFWTQTPA